MGGRAKVGLALGGLLLYAGPVLAGWAGLGWPAVAALAVAFAGWLLAMRTEYRPGAGEGWPGRLALAVAVQVVIVTATYGVGVMLGWAIALPPALSAIAGLPQVLLFSVAGITVARAMYTPISAETEAEIDRMIGEFEREVERFEAQVGGVDDEPGDAP